MAEETFLEHEADRPRAEIAAALRLLAREFDDGSLTLATDDRTAAATPPERLTFDVEFEREDDGTIQLELEFEWPEDQGEVETSQEAEPGLRIDAPEIRDSRARFELYADRAGEWRWRLVHDNGNILADGGEGYASKRNARRGIESVKRNAAGARIDELE